MNRQKKLQLSCTYSKKRRTLHTMEKCDTPHIAIVIVLYNPDKSDIDNILLLSNNYDGIVVDNSDLPSMRGPQVGKMRYIHLGGNKGIAEAHNQALELICKEGKAQFVILLDQDSRLPEDYPHKIVHEYILIKKQFPQLAALGPTIIEKESGKEYHSAIHHDHHLSTNFILKKDVIASGCCFDVSSFTTIGKFDSSLFIDFVDTEWCYRAQSMGYICGTTPNIQLQHKVGHSEIRIGKHVVSISAPFRYYYQYRNYVVLSARSYVPLSFKINFGIKFFLRLLYFPFFVKQGGKCWMNMIKGISAGIKTFF